MDEYLACADQILNGSAVTSSANSAAGKGLTAKHGRIRIVYRPENIRA